MKFENTFAVDAPIDEVYATLLDVERVAPCVPGAEVLEKTGDNAYQVAIKVRVGPISMTYRGNVEIVERDDENHRAVMRARARETRGQGTADARVDLSLEQESATTKGTMIADVQLAGRAAARGARGRGGPGGGRGLGGKACSGCRRKPGRGGGGGGARRPSRCRPR